MSFRRHLALLALLASPMLQAKTCDVAISADDLMKFDKSEISIAADCTEVALTLTHAGKLAANVMGHNWVLAKTADFQALAMEGGKATLADSYIPKGDARAIAFTKVVGGGESTSITFPTSGLTAGGDYTFFCSFPGHWAIMKGKFTFG